MVATRYYRLERPRGQLIAPRRVDLAAWCHRCVSWCLIRTVRRGWTRIPPTGPVQRPLYSAGTAARIERLRVSHPAGCAHPRPSSQAGQAGQAGQTLWWEAAGGRQF
jgi:hypothetical protein